jgi:competence ComEA-like helix-hairpin-helix protein
MPPVGRRFDLAWRRDHLAALLVACLAAGAALGWRGASGRSAVGNHIDADAVRVAAARERINPNTATYASLLRLPGIGPVKAAAIVAFRLENPDRPFASADDLARVHGIGEGIVRRVRPYLTGLE